MPKQIKKKKEKFQRKKKSTPVHQCKTFESDMFYREREREKKRKI